MFMILTILIEISTIQLVNIILVIFLLFLSFKFLESNWSYRIAKPYKWTENLKNKKISIDLRRLERTYQDKVRFYTFWLQIERLKQNNVAGAFAELGVFKGETAKIIHFMDPSRKLLLFDTFIGFSDKDLKYEECNDEKYDSRNFSNTNIDYVKHYIKGNDNISFYKGYFPESIENFPEQKYAFVHLDADLYKPTLAALKYFYTNLSEGGVIIVHDYNHSWDGLRKAIDEFIPSVHENLIEIADSYGSAIIIKSKILS
jgi:O-methyltransferase